MPSSVCKQELILWVFLFFCPSRCCMPQEGDRKPSAECVSVVCHHLSQQSNLRAQTFFPVHSSISCRASDGPGKAMSVAKRQLRQQPDEHEGCLTDAIKPLKEQEYFLCSGFSSHLRGSWSRAAGWGWQGTLWRGGSVHHALPTVAEAPTSNSTSRI